MSRLRGLDARLTHWGPPPPADAEPVVLLHGWQDTADTFQFLIDAWTHDTSCVALDWRGFGGSGWAAEAYWFPEYLADLDALLDDVSPESPVRLIGHSMGGNIGCLYAGLRPDRVRSLVNLEGVGLPRSRPSAAPAQLRKWLDQVSTIPPPKRYESLEQLISIVRFRYPRFTEAQCDFIARAWSEPIDRGGVQLRGDARHRWVNPLPYRRDEAEACWLEMTAPMLLVLGEDSELVAKLGEEGSDAALRLAMPTAQVVRIADAGHMLHIERAESVAALIEAFWSRD